MCAALRKKSKHLKFNPFYSQKPHRHFKHILQARVNVIKLGDVLLPVTASERLWEILLSGARPGVV
jgi:hypothetical protein